MTQSPVELAAAHADSVVLVPTFDGPVFRCREASGVHFLCSNCSNFLIENYSHDDFIGVGIECFQCKFVNFTPLLPEGEVFAPHIVALGDKALYTLSKTIETRPGITITCNQAIKTAYGLYVPRDEMLPFDFSDEGLNALVSAYDEITGGKFGIQDKKLERSRENGDDLKYPFAWSIRYLRKCIEINHVDVDDLQARTSFMWINMFRQAVGKWQHHPRFKKIARDMGKPDSFLHTTSQLIVAEYMFRHGNNIGLSLEEKQGEPNPDLYVRGVLDNRAYLEVKAPRKLQGVRQVNSSFGFVDGVVKATIDGSVGQINKRRIGALIIFSSLYHAKGAQEIERCVTNWLRLKGHNRKSLAAV